MDLTGWIAELDASGPPFVAAARAAGWDAPVPGTDWNVRMLLIHTGAVYRWATDALVRSLSTNETGGSAAFHGDVLDADRMDWFTEGHATLVETLRASPDDISAFTFLPAESPLRFWARRQAHETAIHLLDVQAAAGGPVREFSADFAQDGIAELAGWGRARAFASDRPASLALVASDGPSWLVTFGGERNVIEVVGDGAVDVVAGADAVVAGASEQLYRWVWNRPAPVSITGDTSVAALWARVRIT